MGRYMAKTTLTAPRVNEFALPDGKSQAFLWDTDTKGLGLRVTAGSKSYIFQSIYNGRTIRVTIGNIGNYRIPEARLRARELQQLIDKGTDPRTAKANAMAKERADREQKQARATRVQDAWDAYVKERTPFWSGRHLKDHRDSAQAGGETRKRSDKETKPGVLFPLMGMKLSDVTPETITALMTKEGKVRPARARLALRLIKAFLRWAANEPSYAGVANALAVTSKAREAAGKAVAKDDVLLAEQLGQWFSAVKRINNPVISSYLQGVLITGARREELMGLQWEDVNTAWRTIDIRDKANSKGGQDGKRTIPLTPYMAALLAGLPRRNKWVFSSPNSETGQLSFPTKLHATICSTIGVNVSLHGLRRSFGSLSEWLDIPAGIIAQIMGHKPSATAEKHYRVRPVDMLRVHHNKFEAWMLEQAGIPVPVEDAPAIRRVK